MNHTTPPPQSSEDQEDRSPKFEWDFHISAVVSSSVGTISDTLGVIEVNSLGTLFATGGIARKIRVYTLNGNPTCQINICTPAKLSSLKWKPLSAGKTMGSADYDGVITEYDLETQMPVFERDEHSGRRIWSMDYSHGSVVGASGSDDGTMQIWDPRHDGLKSVGKVHFGAPVCCVEFSPFGGALIAVGCADRKAYVYDVRNMVNPVAILDGHQRTVSYTRFVDDRTVVTSGTDGCLKMWNIEDHDHSLIRTYRGHTNQRRFVGLSIWRNQGLIGCGSESNQVFVYDKRWGEPIWVHGFEPEGGTRSEHGFVSSICWSQVGDDECTLVGGGSNGVVKIFSGKRKTLTSIS
ncbi:putative transcription factor WD40-like family [Helianthus annuus]|uniref:Putative WD40/YVTN repeat-like-containing domain-containing protein n=1 Tax=Helianthus annuus TaxID=4232 RepID=A0A251SCI1_HELAN|nr:WD repeat-containing protein RUP2 [Helianthus annuus]KAF5766778.1 putative transcription factor WD40-like family [Helianthus annuus]KAJ0453114.1 putative transcription factor WD40-like family [Helianthus annuus]KAJ0458243.1 putative transcription factor WD40-like family [Helianthus annuus]KAJ0475030.1 putative transcription factor WD40-like family [Helianthus annuus]KAJ0650586.1 putative transcription factor WD40-like family [Helianthus annuus]